MIKGEIPKKMHINNNTNNKPEQEHFHKDFGKTTKYLKNMKIEAEKKKESYIIKKNKKNIKKVQDY